VVGLWLLALGAAEGWFGMIGAATITILTLKVSGIPVVKNRMAQTPLPWFPGSRPERAGTFLGVRQTAKIRFSFDRRRLQGAC
jgi:hypothetical protein